VAVFLRVRLLQIPDAGNDALVGASRKERQGAKKKGQKETGVPGGRAHVDREDPRKRKKNEGIRGNAYTRDNWRGDRTGGERKVFEGKPKQQQGKSKEGGGA